jgi:chromosome segregation protein
MVTMDGDVFDKSGVIRGGYKQRDSATWVGTYDTKFATQEEKIREIASLRTVTDEKNRQRELLLGKINDLKLDGRMDDDKVRSFNEELATIQRETNKISAEIKESQLSPEEQSAFTAELLTKKDTLEKSLSGYTQKEESLRQKIDGFNLAEEQKKREVFALQQSMHQNQNDLNQITTLINNVKIELAKVETKKEDLYSSIKQDLGEDHKFTNHDQTEEIDLEDLAGKIGRLKKQLEIIGGTDPEVEKEYEEVKKRFEHLDKESEDLSKAIVDLEKVVVELDKVIRLQFEKEFEQINSDFSRYFKQLFDGGSAKLVLTQKEVTEAEIAREEVQNSTENGLAEGETPSSLSSPHARGGDIEGVGAEKKILHVEDKSFLANMGIDIEACPPGKKIKNINVLSGGEKTMTALALICAIIANNPSPFILFDEVDAALDEANSTKLSNIVEELNHKTQFIIITHNRAIMARANVLYGVTMQGDGISRLISLKLDEAEKLATEKA